MALPTLATKILNLVGLGTTADPASETELRLKPFHTGKKALVVYDGEGFLVYDGSSLAPISLPELQQILSGSVSEIVVRLGSGDLASLDAKSGPDKWVIVSNNDGFQLEKQLGVPCFAEDDITDCATPFLAGLCSVNVGTDEEPEIQYCLTKVDASDFDVLVPPNIWQDSNCIEITGAGTSPDPFKASPKISADAGNILECRSDGLYVDCCVYGADPLGDLL